MRWSNGLRRRILWKMVRVLHSFDYGVLLPLMARLPLFVGYTFSALRGRLNGFVGRDWRSMALETRHVARQSAVGYRILFPKASDADLRSLVLERFETESREEFEGRLISAGRVGELGYVIAPDHFLETCLRRDRGLVLITPHFDSFTLGIVFLGLAGLRVNAMSSTVTDDPRVGAAGRQHFNAKYRGMENWMNGGRILNREEGLRPFYQILERRECLVVLADATGSDGGVAVTPHFLSARRRLAGGALRMARKTGSDLGAFVCRFEGAARYRVKGGPILSASDPLALDTVYGFLSEEILASPGLWWAADLLPDMPVFAEAEYPGSEAEWP